MAMQPDDGGGFVKDEFYESIQAPQWLDFDSPEQPVDDHEWFCKRAGCTHEQRPVNFDVMKFHSEAASNTLQTIPEEMTMNQPGCGRPSSAVTLSAPTFAQRLGIDCDSFAYPLLAAFFCCFP